MTPGDLPAATASAATTQTAAEPTEAAKQAPALRPARPGDARQDREKGSEAGDTASAAGSETASASSTPSAASTGKPAEARGKDALQGGPAGRVLEASGDRRSALRCGAGEAGDRAAVASQARREARREARARSRHAWRRGVGSARWTTRPGRGRTGPRVASGGARARGGRIRPADHVDDFEVDRTARSARDRAARDNEDCEGRERETALERSGGGALRHGREALRPKYRAVKRQGPAGGVSRGDRRGSLPPNPPRF